MQTTVIKVAHDEDITPAVAAAKRALTAGKLVGFATETVYGIAAVASLSETMERLRELKNRPDRPFSLHVGRASDVERYVRDIPGRARRLMAKAWPGPVTLVLPTGGALADKKLQKAGLHDVLCSEDTLGVRCPQGALCEAMLSAVDEPVVAPSANLAGKASPRSGAEVLDQLDGKIDLLLDSGATRYGRDSTIVKFDGDAWQVVRKGVLDERSIGKLMQKTILFVCTGNTCRSPLAEGLAREFLAERLGVKSGELADKDVAVLSAGIWAAGGQRPSPEAVEAARAMGADISRHRSRKLTIELINEADLIFCMSDHHVDEVRRLTGAGSDLSKLRRLDAKADIPDPIGGGLDVYLRTAERINNAIRASLNKELP